MKLLVGHDEYEDRDLLLRIYEDGTHTLSIRPGYRDTATGWGREITLATESSAVTG